MFRAWRGKNLKNNFYQFIFHPIYTVHYAVSFGATLFVFNSFVFAQLNRTSFGIVNDFATQKYPQEMFIGDFNGNKQLDFGTRSKSVVAFFRKNSFGFWVKKQFLLDAPSTAATVADFNNDGYDDVAILEPTPTKIEIFWGGIRDSLVSTKAFSSGKNYENCTAADMNSDGRTDILLFGKSSPGIGVVMQSETGDFYYAATLFRETSFSSIFSMDVNGDNNIDLFAQDWVGNKIKLFQQRSYLKFSLLSQWQQSDAPNQFFIQDMNKDGYADVLINVPDEKLLHIYYGDAFGKYKEQNSVLFSAPAVSFTIADVNGDQFPEILALFPNEKKFVVYWNSVKNAFQEFYEFAAGETPMQIISSPLEGKHQDALVLDKQQNEIFLFSNGKNSPQLENEQQFATGVSPQGIIMADVFHDGTMDIVVANEGSHSLSIFQHQKKEKFDGQLQLPTKAAPSDILFSSGGKSGFLIAHNKTQSLSQLKIQYPSLECSSVQIGA